MMGFFKQGGIAASIVLGITGCINFCTVVYAAGEQPYIENQEALPEQQAAAQKKETQGTSAVYESPGGDYRFYAGGYFQADLLDLYNASPLDDGFNLRATRLALAFDYHKSYQFYFSYDFSRERLYNLYFTYDNFSHFLTNIGQFYPIFGLGNTNETPFITLMELALPLNAFSPSYAPGVAISAYGNPITIYFNVFGTSLGSTVVGRTPYGMIVTAAYAPIHEDTRVLHLGLSEWHQGMDSSHSVSFPAQPEIFAPNFGTLINTGNINNVSTYDIFDGAAAGVYGPFALQSEYLYTLVNRNLNFSQLHFAGYYINASYFLTGESLLYDYKFASFVGITPIKKRFGAVQIALQFSDLDLTNQNIRGGKEYNIAASINWYPFRHMKLLLNYVRAMARPNANGFNQTANMYAFRLQFMY